MRLDASPFVLLDDARAGGTAWLYRGATEVIRADALDEVAPALARLRAAVAGGSEAAGFLAYEAGAALEPRLAPTVRDAGLPLVWFGLFAAAEPIADVAALLPDPAGAWIGEPVPRVTRAAYGAAFARVCEWIAAGDIYQANLTFRADVGVAGDPLALYAAVRGRARAGHSALVWTGDDWLLSFSPELLCAVDAGAITARPMKGTARRAADPAADTAAAADLAASPKQRAENLMIVDLLRNDLSRVAAPGSVAVPALFEVESYPTVHQLTSTVTATLAEGLTPADVLPALFPCGSVTGAPKIRAAEVIHAVEPDARGIYTGAIGRVSADAASFNVAIRTLHLKPGATRATLGLGGGIVADSSVDEEWDEALAKGAFLTAGRRGFDLIETMAFGPVAGIARIDRHLARLQASSRALGFACDTHAARNLLHPATFRLREPARVRLVLARSGAMAVETASLPPVPAAPTARVVPLPVAPADFRLRHKTTDRGFYDSARRQAGTWEVVFVGPGGFLTEGSFTNLFVERAGVLVTPPLGRGLLPGVLRAELIDKGRAVEGDLTPADLAGGFLLGNALRGLVHVAVAK